MDSLPGDYGPGLQHEQKSYKIISFAQKTDNENEIPAAKWHSTFIIEIRLR